MAKKKRRSYNRLSSRNLTIDKRVPIARPRLSTPQIQALKTARAKTFAPVVTSSLSGRPSRMTRSTTKKNRYTSRPVVDSLREFNTKICRSRSTRRAVLFATKNTGKGSRSPKIHKYISKVRC